MLKNSMAALACLYEGLGYPNPMEDRYIRCLFTALVKSGTSIPARRTSVMPVKAFTDLFEGWNCDENLSVKDLRVKCITLMALTFMARPSDLAPMAEQFDPSVGTSSAYTLTRDQVQFHSDGSMTVTLFGTKNDTG